jgi:hypothetical protein
MGKFRKELCDDCTVDETDGGCLCQNSQKSCDNCGMESVLSKHEKRIDKMQNKDFLDHYFPIR